jgi:sigma-E factor negative regulatory protein RseB
MKQLDGYRQVRPAQVSTQLQREGWAMTSLVPGFQLSSCTLRALEPADGNAPNGQVLQAVFSDGLTQVSLFVEALDRQRHKQPLLTQVGATHTLMQPYGNEWWVTVMGDVPADTLKKFYQALERRR